MAIAASSAGILLVGPRLFQLESTQFQILIFSSTLIRDNKCVFYLEDIVIGEI